MKKHIFIILLLLSFKSFSQDTITTSVAKDHINKIATVVGKVASFKLASDGRNINYINIDKPFPDNVFTVVITNAHLDKLGLNLDEIKNKTIYIKGKVSVYKNDANQVPQIFNPISISVKKE